MKPVLLDRWGHPIDRNLLTGEVAGPTISGVRSPLTSYPGDGLNPARLASILREADAGDPIRYLELAETIEERDPHYLGVLSTRKRSVAQIAITVEAASEDKRDEEQAQMVRAWLKRDDLSDEIFDILDCIGKGYSFTEIIWDSSEGDHWPKSLEWRDPRWFRFERHDLATPLQLDANGQEKPLDAFKFIFATLKAKSGLPARGGLARVAAWGYMFKMYAQRDWAIFTQTYGQPIRLGKYGSGASEKDKETLLRAVSNIAGDCAAIIPESMIIEFVESKSISTSNDLYKSRSDWLDQQISKAVLGQTATTDAIAGGHAVGQEHRQVQEDIERADARALSAILNRDLIQPWIQLNYGPQAAYPRLKIARDEPEDLAALAASLGMLVPIGLKVSQKEIRDRFGLAEPEEGDEILGAVPPVSAARDPAGVGASEDRPPNTPPKLVRSKVKRGNEVSGSEMALHLQGPSTGVSVGLSVASDPVEDLADRMQIEAAAAMADMIGTIEAMFAAAGSMEEFREMLLAGFPDVDSTALAEVLAKGLIAAHAGGRAALEDESLG